MATENAVIKYEEAIQRVPDIYHPLIEPGMRVLGSAHKLFEVQKERGFYPPNLSEEILSEAIRRDPRLLSPYNLDRWRKTTWLSPEKLQPMEYRDYPPTKLIVAEMVEGMSETIKLSAVLGKPQSWLIKTSLGAQIRAWKDGDFEETMRSLLNMRQLPRFGLLATLMDRYLDPRGVKYASTAWLTLRDDGLTGDYNSILRKALAGTGEEEKHQVVVADVLGFGGLPTTREDGWSGNTIPSEDPLRKELGSRSYLFINSFRRKFEKKIKPAILKFVPSVTETKGSLQRAAIINLILHEGYGHSQVPFDETTIDVLGGEYVSVKEMACEILSHKAVLELQERVVKSPLKKLVVSASLGWWGADVEDYFNETDPAKKMTSEAYARAADGMLNYYGRRGDIEINSDNGEIRILSLDGLRRSAKQFAVGLKQAVEDEKTSAGSLKLFIAQNIGRSAIFDSPSSYSSAS